MSATATPANNNTPLSVIAAQEEESFVNSFTEKVINDELPQDRGRAKADREAAEAAGDDDEKPTKTTATDKPKTGKPDSEGTRTGSDEGTDDDDEGTSDDKPEGTVDDGEGGTEDDDDAGVEEEESDTELAQAAAAELEKHGVKLKLEDLPKEAQPLVEQQLKLMQAGLTRAMTEARSYRAEESQYRAERAFVEQNPALMIVELLQRGGAELESKVNELLDGAGTDVGKKALEVTTREARSEVLKSINAESEKTQRLLVRADVMENYVRTASTKLNIPFDLVEELVAARLMEKDPASRDLSETELDAIIGKVQKSIAKRMGEKKLSERQDAIRGRQQDKRTTSPAARAGAGGGAPSPTGAKAPKNDEEFATMMATKLGGGRR